MHARVATYRITSGTAQEIAEAARQGMLPILQGKPGFIKYGVADADGTLLSISLWSDRSSADAAVAATSAFVAANLADQLSLIASTVGDLIFYEGTPVAV